MKVFFRLFVICFLAFAVVACNQNSDTNPITKPDPNPDPNPDPKPDPNPDPKPDPEPDPDPDPEPDPETNGLDEIIATRQPGGVVEGKLSYIVEWSEEQMFSYGNQKVSYFMTGFKLSTPKGNTLKAIGFFWGLESSFLLETNQVNLEAEGELEFEGIITEASSLKVIRTLATLKIPVKGSTIDAQGALLLIDDKATMAEDEVRFVADGQFKASFSAPSKDGTFPFSALSDDGKVLVGFGTGEATLNFGEMEIWPISYLAEGKKTPYGTVKQLTGFFNLEKGYGITALAINLKQPKPVEKVVLVCQDCPEDIVTSLTRESFTATDDLWLDMPKLQAFPNWVTGASPIPLPKEASCEDLDELIVTALSTTNRYMVHANNLRLGATLILVAKSFTEFPPGTTEHAAQQEDFQKKEILGWETATKLAEQMEASKCF